MESSSIVERALKSSFRSKTEEGQYVAVEDCLLGHGGVSLVACNDDFVVDDWFDFSNEDGEVEEEEEGGGGGDEEDDGAEVPKDTSLSDSSQAGDDDCSNLSSSPSASSEPILTSELTVPDDDDIAELEWLSQFVDDDSLPEFPTCYLPGKWEQESSAKNRSEPEPRSVLIRPLCFPSPVPVKTRTKRTRHAKKDQPPSSESSSTSSCSSENSSSSCLSFTSVLTSMEFVRSQSEPEKKKKMKKTREPPVQDGPVQFQRRCSHCHVQKTPQWRAGPLGLKTLCNACGVRYKSGRLFPEYRPACSPTFSVEAHSNSHRKVLEMRKRKEMAGNGIEGGRLKLNRMVTSF